MPAKKPAKKTLGKKPTKKREKELKDEDLDKVVGGTTDVTTATTPLEDVVSRKRPGRVKSLNP